jgi:hypothetical protein
VIVANRLPSSLAAQIGPGGPIREQGQSQIAAPGAGVSTEESIRQILRKAKKMKVWRSYLQRLIHVQDAQVPPQTILPHLLSASQLAAQAGYWQIYRLSIVMIGEVLLQMDTPGMALKAKQEVVQIWDQVCLAVV